MLLFAASYLQYTMIIYRLGLMDVCLTYISGLSDCQSSV